MIATCPHCQSGFYIASDLAGKVITCSKCKKQVRAPDRRGAGPSGQPNDGIPFANIAETRVEVEERLKSESEARFDTEKQLKEVIEAKVRADEQSKVDSQARQEAEARLKVEVGARAAMEARLLTETEAKVQAEESAMAAEQARVELEVRFKAETEARSKAQAQAEASLQTSLEAEAKLKDAIRTSREMELKLRDEEVVRMKAEARADGEAESRAHIGKQLQEEVGARLREAEGRAKAENQAKLESQAKRRIQVQLDDEVEARERVEQELAKAKARLRDADLATLLREPVNFTRGLMRLTIVLSLVTAWLSGWFAYRNGYVIWSQFDRPVRLPWFSEPVYLPIILILFCIGGFIAAWMAFLLAIFIIKGFRQPTVFKKSARRHRPKPEAVVEETVSAGGERSEHKMWRSS
jgi:predicted Zn finger-like uncharacterized protein